MPRLSDTTLKSTLVEISFPNREREKAISLTQKTYLENQFVKSDLLSAYQYKFGKRCEYFVTIILEYPTKQVLLQLSVLSYSDK